MFRRAIVALLAVVLMAVSAQAVVYTIRVQTDDQNPIEGVYCMIIENGFLWGDGFTNENGEFSVDVPDGMQVPWKAVYNTSWCDPWFDWQDDIPVDQKWCLFDGVIDTRP